MRMPGFSATQSLFQANGCYRWEPSCRHTGGIDGKVRAAGLADIIAINDAFHRTDCIPVYQYVCLAPDPTSGNCLSWARFEVACLPFSL
jgi:hypothetical protein